MWFCEDKIEVAGDYVIFKSVDLTENNLAYCIDNIKGEIKNDCLIYSVALYHLYIFKNKQNKHEKKDEPHCFSNQKKQCADPGLKSGFKGEF